MSLQQNLSNFMRSIRSIRKQSITEFSEEIGISRAEMQNILKGSCNPNLGTIQHIASSLGIDPEILLISSFSESQLKTILLLLKSFDFISNLPKDVQKEIAESIYHIVQLIHSDQYEGK